MAKAAKNQIISSICDELDKVKESNSGILKYGIISNLISQLVAASVFEEDDNNESESVESADIDNFFQCV